MCPFPGLILLLLAFGLTVQPIQSTQFEFDLDLDEDQLEAEGADNFMADLLKKLTESFTDIFGCSSTEKRSLEQIYRAALKSEANRTMIVYSGGTARGQGNATKMAFEQQFPGLSIEIVTDYSTYQGPRIDAQLANNSLIPDVVQLQTLQDFPRWKEQGHLMKYKPANWSNVYSGFRDAEGYYTANFVFLASTVVNSRRVPKAEWPKTAKDFLRKQFKGDLVIVHPNMDDFVLFYFKQIVDKYGLEYLSALAAQQPSYVCDGFAQLSAIGISGAPTAAVAVGGIASIAYGNASIPQFAFPADNDPFSTYAMYAAIFKKAKMPETAKLYVNWLLQKESPNNQGAIWSVRTDMKPQQGFKPVWEYKNSNHSAFVAFMEDYEGRERFTKQIDLYLGHTTCDTNALIPNNVYPKTA